jgi:hypothetical protein
MEQSDKIFHIDMEDEHIDTVISHIISPYPTSIWWMIISIWWMTILIYHVTYRYNILHIDNAIGIALMSDLPYRSPISISHIDLQYRYLTISCHSGERGRSPPRTMTMTPPLFAPPSPLAVC